MQAHDQPLAELLLEARLVTQETLDALDASEREDERRLGALLVERRLISPARLAQVVSHQRSVPWVSLEKVEFQRDLLSLIPKKMAYRHHVIPVYLRGTPEEGTLYVATDDPTRDEVLTACHEACGLRVRFMGAAPDDVRRAIETHYGRRSSMVMAAVGVSIVGAPGLGGPESRRRPPPPPPVQARPQSPAPPDATINEAEEEGELDELLDEDEDEGEERGDAITAEPSPEEEVAPRSALAARIDQALEETWAGELDDEPLVEEPPPPEPTPPSAAAAPSVRRPPVILLVAPPAAFVDTCTSLALSLPARVEAVTLSEANVRALATEPIVIVVTDDVYEFDRLAFNQLAMAVRAPLVVWSADLDPEDLEPVLAMAYRSARG